MPENFGETRPEAREALDAFADEEGDATAREIASRIADFPDEHVDELHYVAEEVENGDQFEELIETSPVPRMWGYPAVEWETLTEMRERRREGEDDRRVVEAAVLIDKGYEISHVAELMRTDEDEVQRLIDE